MIRVALRLDDPSETSHQGVEAGILDTLLKYHACATFAVIPFRMVEGQRRALSESRAQPLIESARAGIIEIALHGHVHVRLQQESASPSEFTGRPQSEQHALIAEGHAHLERVFGQSVTGFVPPWNSYDAATLRALEQSGFRYVSAGWDAPGGYRGPIKLLPLTAHLNDIPTALAEARRFSKANPIIVIVMHHYDFAESGSDRPIIDMPGFAAALAKLSGEPDVRLCRLGDIAASFGATDRPMRQHYLWARHARLHRLLPRHSILDAPLWRGMIAGALNI
jgi:peptidoglycan/xylan/chitin deacetylase (PgdA/CDA1 family)